VGSKLGVEVYHTLPHLGCLHGLREAFLLPTENLKNVIFDYRHRIFSKTDFECDLIQGQGFGGETRVVDRPYQGLQDPQKGSGSPPVWVRYLKNLLLSLFLIEKMGFFGFSKGPGSDKLGF
jgi:hypothetical protein